MNCPMMTWTFAIINNRGTIVTYPCHRVGFTLDASQLLGRGLWSQVDKLRLFEIADDDRIGQCMVVSATCLQPPVSDRFASRLSSLPLGEKRLITPSASAVRIWVGVQ